MEDASVAHDYFIFTNVIPDTTAAEIRRLNRLFSDNIHGHATLLVPALPETSECAAAMCEAAVDLNLK